jgi:hypothetical protein
MHRQHMTDPIAPLSRMFWRSLIVMGASATVCTPGFGQDKSAAAMSALNVVLPRAAEERLALSALPVHLRAGASVYVYGKTGFGRTRNGTNGFTCLVNRDAFFYGAAEFKPTCWDSQGETTYVPVMLKTGELLALGQSFGAIKAAIDAGFANKTFHTPESGGVAYMLAGDVDVDPATGSVIKQVSPGHYMFYANHATNAQLGYTRDAAKADPTLPFVTTAGAGADHGLTYLIVVPGEAHQHAHSPN